MPSDIPREELKTQRREFLVFKCLEHRDQIRDSGQLGTLTAVILSVSNGISSYYLVKFLFSELSIFKSAALLCFQDPCRNVHVCVPSNSFLCLYIPSQETTGVFVPCLTDNCVSLFLVTTHDMPDLVASILHLKGTVSAESRKKLGK